MKGRKGRSRVEQIKKKKNHQVGVNQALLEGGKAGMLAGPEAERFGEVGTEAATRALVEPGEISSMNPLTVYPSRRSPGT